MNSTGDSDLPPIPNPYIVGNPIEDQRMFFGREDDFNYIKQKVTGSENGGLIVLCGTRRSGKTSILFQLKGGRLGQNFVPVLVDMQAMTVRDDREFLGKLGQTIIATLDDPDISFERDLQPLLAGNPYSAFQDLIPKFNTSLQGKKLVLMFDEYEIFESHIAANRLSMDILHMMANWMESREGVFIVFTGSDKLESRSTDCWNSFLGKALHRRISFLSRDDTLRLVLEPLTGVVTYEEGVPEEIYKLTAGQPFYSQVLCQSIIDHLNEAGKYEVSTADTEQAVGEIIENPLPHMVFTWSSLTSLEKIGLSITAEMSKAEARPIRPNEIQGYTEKAKLDIRLDDNKLQEAAERLFHSDLLQKSADGDSYTFKMDLWRLWVSRMHSIYQTIDEIGAPEGELGDGIRVATGRRRRTVVWIGAAIVILAVAGLFITRVLPGRQESVTTPSLPVVVVPDSTLLSVTTEPANATVFLAEQRLGRSPIVNRRVPAGSLPLAVELDGYKAFDDTLMLTKGQPLQQDVVLIRRQGSLRVISRPAGARIVLNGTDAGLTTPATITDLAVDQRYRLVFKFPGYRDGMYGDLTIPEDSTKVVTHDFVQMTHPLTVVTDPADAVVYLDDDLLGTAPRNLNAVSAGRHQLEARRAGYSSVRQTIAVPVPDNVVEMVLTRLPPGKLVIQIQPYADVWIDNQLKAGSTVFYEIELDAGTYSVELRHPSYQPFTETVEIESGATSRVGHDFSGG